MERQKLSNEKESEKERCKLLELQAIAAAVESSGQAKAEAQAQAERIIIECESEIEGEFIQSLLIESSYSLIGSYHINMIKYDRIVILNRWFELHFTFL